MTNAIETTALTKQYGRDLVAVNDVTVSFEADRIHGLLGRNGAGKTTLMQLVTGQIFATSGDIRVFGEAPLENAKVLAQSCFIQESQKYPDIYTPRDVFGVAAGIYAGWDQAFAEQLIAEFRLPEKRRIKKLSRGQLSAVGIIVGLASRAPLTFFDEPYLGLDAVARQIFYDRLLADYAEHPRTVILSTHHIDEAAKLLEHIVVIDQGKILIDQDADELRGTAFTVSGRATDVDAFGASRTVIDRTGVGSLATATILGDTEEQEAARTAGLDLSPVSLQELIVHLTTETAASAASLSTGELR